MIKKTVLLPKSQWNRELIPTEIEIKEKHNEWTDRNMNYRIPVYSDACEWVYCERMTLI